MEQPLSPSASARSLTLLLLRIYLWIIWAALLFASFMFTMVLALILRQPQHSPPPDPHIISVLLFVAITVGGTLIPAVHTARFFLFRFIVRRQSWIALAIAYPLAKIIVWAACNSVVYFALVTCIIAQSFLPLLPVAAAAWLVIVVDPPLCRPFRAFASSPALPSTT